MNKSIRVLTGQLCLIELVAWGVLYYTFSAFMPNMEAELRWNSATLAGGFSLALLISGVGAPVVGAWIDRRGSRELMVAGATIGSLGVLLWSVASVLPIYYLAWVLIGLAMAGILYAPAFATVVRFQPEASRNSILIITLVAALASTVFIPLSSLLGEWFGWRTALRILAAILAIATIPLAAFLPRFSIPTTKQRQSTPEAVPKRKAPGSFWLVTIAFMLADTAGVALNAYLVVFLVSQGHGLQAAAATAGLSGVAKIGGRLATAVGGSFSALALLVVRCCLNPLPCLCRCSGLQHGAS